ncbi:MAG: LecA/PA-IL family lectin [Acidobacteria bacterium]|nr:LecA/PA-IL family lectin [Acidobacteriota bacterium]
MKKIILALAGILLLAPLALGDTIVLRDGRTLRGTVLGFMNGRIVVRLAPGGEGGGQTSADAGSTAPGAQAANDGEIRFFRPAEIERIEIDGRSLEEARYDTRTVNVALGPNWIDSGVDVRRGQRVQVRASGTIYAGRSRITPDGLRTTDPSSPLPRAAEGALIGAVGTDPDTPVEVLGLGREFVADRDGRLYLTANRGTYTDARGAFVVRVQTERQLPQRRRDTAGRDIEETDDPFDPNRTTRPAPARSRTPGGSAPNDPLGNRGGRREVSIEVPGTSRGTDTGIDLRSGDRVTITATGQIVAGRRAGSVGPEGGQSTGFGSIVSSRPAPNAGVGALIGLIRLADGQVTQAFIVGGQLTFTAQADGRLILLVNDDNYNDNSGNFGVRINVN